MIGRTNGGVGTGATLTVEAPAGCTVTISKDGKTKTKTAGSDGLAVFKGLATGEWTVTITDGIQTASKVVSVTADYATSITFFAATINVTYPAGSTCTATNGVTTRTSPDTSGRWEFVVTDAGTWTISLSSGFTDTINVTTKGKVYTLDSWPIYKLGDEFVNITGGWNARDWSGNKDHARLIPALTKNSDGMHIVFTGQPSGQQKSGVVEVVKNIDLTNFNKFVITYKGTSDNTSHWRDVVVTNRSNQYWRENYIARINLYDNQTVYKEAILDISGINGSYDIVLGGKGGTGYSDFDIYEIRLGV